MKITKDNVNKIIAYIEERGAITKRVFVGNKIYGALFLHMHCEKIMDSEGFCCRDLGSEVKICYTNLPSTYILVELSETEVIMVDTKKFDIEVDYISHRKEMKQSLVNYIVSQEKTMDGLVERILK